MLKDLIRCGLEGNHLDEETCWKVARQVLSRFQYLGIQDAARKTRPPTRDQRSASAGTVFETSSEGV